MAVSVKDETVREERRKEERRVGGIYKEGGKRGRKGEKIETRKGR